jgi:hypothetical protein
VLDGGVSVGFLPAAMAADVLRVGAMEGGGEVVEELHGVDVVLAEGLWWRGRARSELPTVSRRRRRKSS